MICSNCHKPLVALRRRRCLECGVDLCQKCGINIFGKQEVLCAGCAAMAHCCICGEPTNRRTGGHYLCGTCLEKGELWAARQVSAQQG